MQVVNGLAESLYVHFGVNPHTRPLEYDEIRYKVVCVYVCVCAQQSWGAMGDGDSDEFKRVLLEGNPIFLGLTFFVSLLHSVFDFFAFKNDIGFWKNKKSVEGLSVRTIGINCFCQVGCAVLC